VAFARQLVASAQVIQVDAASAAATGGAFGMAKKRGTGTRRIWLPAIAMGLFAMLIRYRLFEIQVLEHDRYAAQAEAELQGSSTQFARRGAILDRNGHVFAASVDTWDIYVNARSWADEGNALRASTRLSTLTGQDPAAIRGRVLESGLIDVIVARDVSYADGRALLDERLPGIIALPNTDRVHAHGDLAAGLIGVFGVDNVGLSGIEASLNDVLQGSPGRALFERDTSGEPVPGKDVVLTIDRFLQRLVEDTLASAVQRHEASGGTIIIMDPSTAEILALATMPSLKFSSLNLLDPAQVGMMRNRAVTDMYEPGSVMKVITAAAAIDAGMVSPGTTYVDTGVTNISGVDIRNWDYNVYGEQTMTGVLQHSINTGAIYMADMLGPERFHAYIDAFGFGHTTGIELSGEATGIYRTPDDPGWSPVDLATQSFGQAISVTPLQMTNAFAATINGGRLLEPRLVKAYVSASGERTDTTPAILGQPISAQTSATLRRMLEETVDPGWYHPAQPQRYTAGGKSGTANVPIPNGSYDDTQVASFIGFAPVHDPRIVILVKLDDNRDRLTGTQAAGPIFAELVDAALSYLNVIPDAARYTEAR
jgi:stage V sporulation protein D (sporulation-specific penicillin-binding protein)